MSYTVAFKLTFRNEQMHVAKQSVHSPTISDSHLKQRAHVLHNYFCNDLMLSEIPSCLIYTKVPSQLHSARNYSNKLNYFLNYANTEKAS